MASECPQFYAHRQCDDVCPAGARALLEKARSVDGAGDRMGARAAYQEFLLLWKDADPDVPVLAQAQADYATLK